MDHPENRNSDELSLDVVPHFDLVFYEEEGVVDEGQNLNSED